MTAEINSNFPAKLEKLFTPTFIFISSAALPLAWLVDPSGLEDIAFPSRTDDGLISLPITSIAT